jgi:isopenicillin-N N-acyltransferase like protein
MPAQRNALHRFCKLNIALCNILFAAIYLLPLIPGLPCSSTAAAADARPFREGKFEAGALRYINDLPVLIVSGTPDEIGRQKAVLTSNAVQNLVEYPKKFLSITNQNEDRIQKLIKMSEQLKPQVPDDLRVEMRTFSEKTGLAPQWDMGLLANMIIDLPRTGINCSSIIVEPSRSATGGPLFGRNLDFFTLGLLDNYSLVTVHRPKNKHAFVSIGFPGLFGCLSGMNDAGLALAVHEIYLSGDGSSKFNPKGVPYTMSFRRILEECSTIEEAEKLMRSTERTTMISLSVCDRNKAAVFEMTPKTVAVRSAVDGLCYCTNHFRTPELIMFALCPRYHTLEKSQSLKKLDIEDVAKKLDQVNMGNLTVQTMVFEPAPLILHLAIGSCPSSALPLKKLDLQPLFKTETTVLKKNATANDNFFNQTIPDILKLPDAPPTARRLDAFKRIKASMSMEDVVRLCGVPDQDVGSGIYVFIYKLDDGSTVRIGTADLKKLLYVQVHLSDGQNADLLKK